jgi:hypothetical protein
LSGVCAPSALHHCAGKQTLAAVSTTWKWQTKAETAGTTVNTDELAIAVLQLGATRPPAGVTWRSRAEADPDENSSRTGRRVLTAIPGRSR